MTITSVFSAIVEALREWWPRHLRPPHIERESSVVTEAGESHCHLSLPNIDLSFGLDQGRWMFKIGPANPEIVITKMDISIMVHAATMLTRGRSVEATNAASTA